MWQMLIPPMHLRIAYRAKKGKDFISWPNIDRGKTSVSPYFPLSVVVGPGKKKKIFREGPRSVSAE
jgi:hypothetical protein